MIKMKPKPLKSQKRGKANSYNIGVICLEKGGKILVGKVSLPKTGGSQWSIPNGSVKKEERCVDAALRIFEEETGHTGGFRIVDSITLLETNNKYKIFILVIPYLNPGSVSNGQADFFTWVPLERLSDLDPKHQILEKIIKSGELNEEKVSFYISLVGEQI
jgi:8-oxo-dGTP pyrophosphatase MutT (NUDIX family)